MNLQSNTVSIKLPRGDQASFEEMQAYDNALRTFICQQEGELEHIDKTKDHNSTVDYLHSLADRYNTQLHLFKEAEERRQRGIIKTLILITRTNQW